MKISKEMRMKLQQKFPDLEVSLGWYADLCIHLKGDSSLSSWKIIISSDSLRFRNSTDTPDDLIILANEFRKAYFHNVLLKD